MVADTAPSLSDRHSSIRLAQPSDLTGDDGYPTGVLEIFPRDPGAAAEVLTCSRYPIAAALGSRHDRTDAAGG